MKYFYSFLVIVAFLLGNQTKINAQASCAAAAPFCTSTGVNFPASTSTTAPAGPNYGCLGSQPNPAWYYLNVATNGNIQINLSNSANVDIDFILWGPFATQASMCANLNGSAVDCSYSTAANEQVDIPNATAGQWYMLLITNFSGVPTNITAAAGNAPGNPDGTTNCAILCNMTGLTANPGACSSPANTFTLTGTITATNPPSTGTLTVTNSCGGSQTFNPPFAGSIAYSIPNVPATGGGCTVTATYSADPTCTLTTGYTAPPSCIVAACLINNFTANISACDPITNAYTVNGTVTFTNPPASGTMTVTNSCGGSQTFNAPFVSPINYNITGIPADATPGCNVSVAFSAAGACTSTVGPYTEPFCPCNMDNMFVNIGACDPVLNTFTVTVDLDFTSPPSSGSLQVTVCGVTQNLPMPATSPQTFTFSGLPSDGSACTADAFFTADPACGNSLPFNSPNGCLCPADAGTFNDNIAGSAQTDFLLCFNDVLNINSNGDMTPSDDFTVGWTPPPAPTYDPGLWLLVYSCPPTITPPGDLLTDPCLLGVYSSVNGSWSILNDIGDGSTLYFVPLTMYSMVDGIYAIAINGGDWCYDMGPTYPVTFLPDITATGVENCAAGSATITVQGGNPAVNGGNFTASNLSPATAVFSNTTSANGGTIVITGLANGDMYSFDITDPNGCPHTFSDGPFVGPAATAINPAGPFCLSDPSVNLTVVPATAGTWTGTGITNGVTGTFDPTTAGLGTFTITFTPSGCFLPSTVNITVNDVFDATISPAGPFCESNANTFLGAVDPGGVWSGTGIVDPVTGEFSPAAATIGNNTITYTIAGACGATDTETILVIADADATITPAGPFCITDPALNLTAVDPGGVWSGTGITSAANGTFNPATAGPGTHTITYNISGVCGDQQTTDIVVIDLFPTTITPVGPFCEDANPVTLVGATPGGTWSGPGITNPATGAFDPGAANIGINTVTYTIAGGCGTSSTLDIVVNALPVPVFVADVVSGCAPLTVTFTDNTAPAGASCLWVMSDGFTTGTCGTVTHTFNAPGVYNITLTLTSAAGCVGTTTVNAMITVFANPVADFTFAPTDASVMNSTVNFTNTSSGATIYNWDFDGLGTSTATNPSFTFPIVSPDSYLVCLEASTVNGCIDSTCQTIIVYDIFIIYVPNAFTPDGDGINDVFLPILSGLDPLTYELMIFNRWGELIFETQNYGQSWDGYYKGIMSQEDVYVWKIKVKDAIHNEKHDYIGHVTLLK
jgi:gliding motility-associated-like protein